MAQPVPAPTPIATFGAPVTVIGQEFVAPYPIDLAIVRKILTWRNGSFVVTDSSDTIIFKVKGHVLSMHDRRELLDASGKTLVTLHQKVFSMHARWRVFRGESTDEKDLLFMVKRSKALQFDTKLHVFLGQNPNEDVWDYRIEDNVIYAGNTNDMVAQIGEKDSIKSTLIGKTHYELTVYPNIDHAFIVSMVVILDDINVDMEDEAENLVELGNDQATHQSAISSSEQYASGSQESEEEDESF